MNLFGWLRTRARDAVIAGVGDALADLTAGETDGEDVAIALLQSRLERPAALIEALPEETKRGKRGGAS